MDVSELKSIISRKLEIPISDIGREDFREYGVRFRYLGSSYRATTDLAVEKVEGGCLVTDDDARRIEKLLRTEEWDGEGLPPVGCHVEARYGGEWVEATVAYTDRHEGHSDAVAWKEALVFDCKTTRPFWADEFRPIRSEADKKRDEAIESIKAMLMYDYGDDPRLNDAVILYDAIAAGKIPHIRID